LLYSFSNSNSVIALAEINRHGDVMVNPLISNRQGNILMRPKVSKQMSRREMVIFGENGKKFKFATLQFL